MPSLPTLTLLLFSFLSSTSAQNCYLPNGTDRNARDNRTNAYQTCNRPRSGGSGHSMCCRLGLGTPDTCLDSGLCQDASGTYWRESCTDPTWQDPACVRLYISDNYENPQSDDDLPVSDDDVPLLQCADGSWCLGESNRACCTAEQGFKLVDGVVIPASQTSALPTSAATISTSSPSQTTATASSSPAVTFVANASQAPNEVGIIVGGVVGGIGGGALAAIVVWLLLRRRRRTDLEPAPQQQVFLPPVAQKPVGQDPASVDGQEKSQFQVQQRMANELASQRVIHELSAPLAELSSVRYR